jgi:ABC-type lipoprotein export system ATPase subunit
MRRSRKCILTLKSPEDVVIPVMGMSGSGKTTFISLCTQRPMEELGDELLSSENLDSML